MRCMLSGSRRQTVAIDREGRFPEDHRNQQTHLGFNPRREQGGLRELVRDGQCLDAGAIASAAQSASSGPIFEYEC